MALTIPTDLESQWFDALSPDTEPLLRAKEDAENLLGITDVFLRNLVTAADQVIESR